MDDELSQKVDNVGTVVTNTTILSFSYFTCVQILHKRALLYFTTLAENTTTRTYRNLAANFPHTLELLPSVVKIRKYSSRFSLAESKHTCGGTHKLRNFRIK